MHPGIPINAADLDQIAGAVDIRLKKVLCQGLHRLVEILHIVLLVLQEPFPVIVEPNTPEKIYGFGRKTFKHIFHLILYSNPNTLYLQ